MPPFSRVDYQRALNGHRLILICGFGRDLRGDLEEREREVVLPRRCTPATETGGGGAECLRYRVKFKAYAELAKAGSLRSVTSDLGRRVLLGSMARCGPRFFTIVARVLEYRSAPESSVAHILNVSLCHFSASPRADTDLRLRRSRGMGSIVLCSDECNRSSSSRCAFCT